MKHLSKLLFLLSVSPLLLWVNCFADCGRCPDGARFVACPKTYITPGQVDLSEGKILVRMNDWIVETETLTTDERGIFFSNARSNGCGYYEWKCTRALARGMPCDTCNWNWNSTCSYCGGDKTTD